MRCMSLDKRTVRRNRLDGTPAQPSSGFLSTATFAGIVFDMTLKARVQKGRLVFDEPTDLPEGTEVELLPLDPGDWLNDEDRSALHRALVASEADVEAGRVIDANEVLRELRSE